MARLPASLLACVALAACDSSPGGRPRGDLSPAADSGNRDLGSGHQRDAASSQDGAAAGDASPARDAAPAQPCTTRITYGKTWIKPAGHGSSYDDVAGVVTWDGSCTVDGQGNAHAQLSNGWQPYFQGRSCVIALDLRGDCSPAPGPCATRVSYGPAWLPAPNHPNRYDDVAGALTWDGICHASGGESWAQLSNGWQPHFAGSNGCDLAFRHQQCGGLYANPVVDSDCPDPGVLAVGDEYYMVCTPGPGYPIRSSKDLVSWKKRGTVFDANSKPQWAASHFWAPEVHQVGNRFVVYFSAKNAANNVFAIGAAWANDVLGPYTDIGKPLVTEPAPGAIDAHHFQAADGQRYILWKVDGNAVGKATPIKIQRLAADGLSLQGSPTTILSNTLSWEGPLVEGPWMIERSGTFYLFYSGNGYWSASYGVGVARAASPLGPFEKAGGPILSSKGAWAGPGHGAVLRGPSGDWVHVYHSWVAGKLEQAPGRIVLVDRLQWSGGWPAMRGAPSSGSQPLP